MITYSCYSFKSFNILTKTFFKKYKKKKKEKKMHNTILQKVN